MTNVPDFRVTLGDQDLTAKIRPRLISLQITEKRGGEADQLDIALDDTDGLLELPDEGATLSVQIGWKSGSEVTVGLVDKGQFIVDEVQHNGPPDTITIRAHAADFTADLKTRAEKSWHDTTLGAIVKDIGGKHGLTVRCADALASIAIKSASQTRESDIAFLRRLGREHDAVATIKRGTLLFSPIGAGVTPSGKALPSITITRRLGDRHQFSIEKREEAGKVTASWHDRKGAAKKTVTVGDGSGAERKLSRVYASEEAAKKAAAAESKRAGRAPRKMELTLSLGRGDVFPELRAVAQGFKRQINDTSWLISELEHSIDGGGYRTKLMMEVAS